MANTSSTGNLGTLGVRPPFFSVGAAPSIFFEWAALLPLVIYLANFREAHRLVGKAALSGRIEIGLLPKLGVLEKVANLLKEGSDFLDQACSIGELRKEVWDANWGSVFPCANGTASSVVAAYALRRSRTIPMPETVKQKSMTAPNGGANSTSPSQCSPTQNSPNKGAQYHNPPSHEPATVYRRYQKLHVLHFSGDLNLDQNSRTVAALDILAEVLLLSVLGGATAIAYLFGLYGTTACILIAILVRICRRLIVIKRAADYLQDNERGRMQACMLTAIHQNAFTWYLYVGNRGIVDGLLNKSMISSVTSVFGDYGTSLLSLFLRCLAMVQLAAMTYVAAQKGWDGVALLASISVAWIFEKVPCSPNLLAYKWLRKSRVRVEARSFLFSGRVVMLGAIQIFKANPVTAWMDGIVVPSQRRNVLLHGLCGFDDAYMQGLANLENNDKEWVELYLDLCRQAAERMRREFNTV